VFSKSKGLSREAVEGKRTKGGGRASGKTKSRPLGCRKRSPIEKAVDGELKNRGKLSRPPGGAQTGPKGGGTGNSGGEVFWGPRGGRLEARSRRGRALGEKTDGQLLLREGRRRSEARNRGLGNVGSG